MDFHFSVSSKLFPSHSRLLLLLRLRTVNDCIQQNRFHRGSFSVKISMSSKSEVRIRLIGDRKGPGLLAASQHPTPVPLYVFDHRILSRVPVVLECIFSFDLSIPLNYLFEGFEKKILIIQGMRDSLCDSRSKVAKLKEHCKGQYCCQRNRCWSLPPR